MKEQGERKQGKKSLEVAPSVLEEKGEPLYTHQQGMPTLPQPQCGLGRNRC